MRARQGGSTAQESKRPGAERISCRSPIAAACCSVGKAIAALRARLTANVAESRTLAELRNALLPKLMSGEVRVEDPDRILGGLRG